MPRQAIPRLLLLATLLTPSLALAQAVAAAGEAPPASAWSREVDFGFTGSGGNATAFSLDLGPQVDYRSGRWHWETSGSLTFTRIEREDNETLHERFTHVEVNNKLRREFSPRLYSMLIATADRKPHAGIASEWLGGAGLGWRIVPEGALTVSVEIAATFTHERFVHGPHIDYESLSLESIVTAGVFQDAELTWSNHVKFGRGEGSSLKSDQTLGLTTPLSPRFSLKIELEWEFNSQPPLEALKSDYRVVSGLALRL